MVNRTKGEKRVKSLREGEEERERGEREKCK
jgi:hypothetical protein